MLGTTGSGSLSMGWLHLIQATQVAPIAKSESWPDIHRSMGSGKRTYPPDMKAVSSEWDKRVVLQWDSSSAMVVLLEEHLGTHSAWIEAPRAAATTRAPLMTALSLEKQICWFFLHFLMDKRSRHSSAIMKRFCVCYCYICLTLSYSATNMCLVLLVKQHVLHASTQPHEDHWTGIIQLTVHRDDPTQPIVENLA